MTAPILKIAPAAHQHAQDLLSFIDASPSPWHATAVMSARLRAGGFNELVETEAWKIEAGGRYFVIRGGASLIAFVAGEAPLAEAGYRMVGAHTDSPGLRLKPHAAHLADGFIRLGVEVYGSPILATFTDRDLSLAGRVHVRTDKGVEARLLHVDFPVLRLPNLAIHMNRDVNEQGLRVHRQHELNLLFAVDQGEGPQGFQRFLDLHSGEHAGEIVSTELIACDTQPGTVWGVRSEFLANSQLDNLASCHAALVALLEVAQPPHTAVAAFFDHEEVGSESARGAAGSFFEDVLGRLAEGLAAHGSDAARARARSTFLSVDMAHAWNPNYPAAYEPQHRLMVNAGPAIKHNASQRYASDGEGVARFIGWCEAAGVPWQSYVHRSELACGSTIGPLVAARLGITTVDVGAPMWAMHSVRESAGVLDSWWLTQALFEALQQG